MENSPFWRISSSSLKRHTSLRPIRNKAQNVSLVCPCCLSPSALCVMAPKKFFLQFMCNTDLDVDRMRLSAIGWLLHYVPSQSRTCPKLRFPILSSNVCAFSTENWSWFNIDTNYAGSIHGVIDLGSYYVSTLITMKRN